MPASIAPRSGCGARGLSWRPIRLKRRAPRRASPCSNASCRDRPARPSSRHRRARGRVTPPASLDALPADTTVVSLMLANNETGVVQPVADLAARARARGLRVHCDGVQGTGKIAVDVTALGVDYFVFSGHKLGGPKGAG